MLTGAEGRQVHSRILLVDDHPYFRHLLRVFLEQNPEWEVCGEAADGCEALARTTELHPDIVLMDLQMPRLNGIEATKKIHQQHPSTRVLILTLHDSEMLTEIARDSGASGYVLKSEPLEALVEAIRTLGEREGFFFTSRGTH